MHKRMTVMCLAMSLAAGAGGFLRGRWVAAVEEQLGVEARIWQGEAPVR